LGTRLIARLLAPAKQPERKRKERRGHELEDATCAVRISSVPERHNVESVLLRIARQISACFHKDILPF
jgi:hypothetical protein